MTIGKTLILASAVIIGASSVALAQGPTGNTNQNAAAGGGHGSYAGAVRSGSAANSQVYKDQNGHDQ